MITSRRSFITGLGVALVTAPAIVRAGSLMPVKQMIEIPTTVFDGTLYVFSHSTEFWYFGEQKRFEVLPPGQSE